MSRMSLIRPLKKQTHALMILLTFPGDFKDWSRPNQINVHSGF